MVMSFLNDAAEISCLACRLRILPSINAEQNRDGEIIVEGCNLGRMKQQDSGNSWAFSSQPVQSRFVFLLTPLVLSVFFFGKSEKNSSRTRECRS